MSQVILEIDNMQKRDTYAILKANLKKALNQHFWFEACMIEYAIIEDRTASILLHTSTNKNPYDVPLSRKLNSIEQQIGKKHPVISKKVDPKLITEIKEWKDTRNEAVHRACIHVYDETEMEQIAEQGNDLVRRISNDSQKVKKLSEKIYSQENQK